MIKRDAATNEEAVRWGTDFRTWQSHMGVSPVSVPSDLVLTATGVDGRTTNGVRRYMGNVLVEDAKRLPLRADMFASTASGTPLSRQLRISAERVAQSLIAGNTVVHQVFPFEVSRHSTTAGGLTWRGFVVRLAPVLRMGLSDTSGSDVNFSSPTRPFVVLLVLADNEDTTLSASESRFRLVLPLTPVSRIYTRDGSGTGLPHYKDYDSVTTFPNFTPEDGSAATTPIYCSDPITVDHNNRFIHLFSTTGEFQPVILWYDTRYGLLGESTNTLMSTRSSGWHWERFGAVVGTPANPSAVVETGVGTGSSLARVYDFAYRFRDLYRFRRTAVSERVRPAISNATRSLQWDGAHYSATDDIVEQCLHYPVYDALATIGDTTQHGGTLFHADRMSCVNTAYLDRFALYAARATTVPFQTTLFATTRTDNFGIAGGRDLSYANDLSIANGTPYSSASDPGPTPTRVLASVSYQGVTIIAEESTEGGNSTSSLNQTAIGSGRVTLRWSDTVEYAPEIFPSVNSFVTNIAANLPVQLVVVGDFAFLLGDGQVVRLRRVGSGMEVTELLSGLNLVSTRAAVDVNGMLFGVFRDGCAAIEPSSGSMNPAPELDRVIQDMWPDSLQYIKCCYDAALNAVIILNSYTGTAIMVWVKTRTITALEGTNFVDVVPLRYRNVRRAILVTNSARFVTPRLYDGEDTHGTRTLIGITQTPNHLPLTGRSFYAQVVSSAYNTSLQATEIEIPSTLLPGPLAFRRLLQRDGMNSVVLATNNVDYYYFGASCYHLGPTNQGTRYTVLGVKFDPLSSEFRLLLRGNTALTLAPGDYISIDPIVFGLLMGPCETDTDECDGLQKRHAKYVMAIVPHQSRELPTEVPFLEAGVVDYASIKAVEPQPANGTLWRSGTTAVEQARRTVLPLPGVGGYSSDYPNRMVNSILATGHLLFPYVKCYITDASFEMKELWVRGSISPSETTE